MNNNKDQSQVTAQNREDWRRATLVTAPGEFSSRGDVFDLFPAGFPAPVRLEFFGDDLESIRRFDPESQRATGSVERVSFSTRMQQVEFCGLLDHFDSSAPVPSAGPRSRGGSGARPPP